MTREKALKVIRDEINLCVEESVDALELEDVYSLVEHSISLDRIKEARKEIENLDGTTDDYTYGTEVVFRNMVDVKEVLGILDKLIAEVEG